MHTRMANQSQADVPIPWRPLALWTADQQPAELWPWLSHAGSLTDKLRAAVGTAFHVEVLQEGVAQLSAEDAGLLHTLPGTAVRQREVHLCGNKPLVYARTLAPANAAEWLHDLNNHPLGDRVFTQSDIERGVIEVTQLQAPHTLYRVAVAGTARAPAPLWARRSVLTVRGKRLLIYECFLDVPTS